LSEKAFISLGSNVEPEKYLPLAVARLSSVGRLVGISRVYQNKAVGGEGQPDFLNAAALVVVDDPPEEVRGRLRAIERALGRERAHDRFAPRTIDLDLCLYGRVVMTSSEMVLPHPQVTSRAYVAVPLAELEPAMAHPVTGATLASLAEGLTGSGPLIPRPDVEAQLRPGVESE